MLRHHPRVLGGLLLTAALVVSGGVSHATPEDALTPLEKYTTLKGRSLASAHRTRLLQFSTQIYNCMPWLDMHRGMSAVADIVDDSDVAGLSVALTWRKPDTTRPGRQAVNETFSLFIDK